MAPTPSASTPASPTTSCGSSAPATTSWLSVVGESQTITVAGWYVSSHDRVGAIVAGDGFTLGAADVNQLVQAMASHSPPPAGQLTLPADLASDLAAGLASWTRPGG